MVTYALLLILLMLFRPQGLFGTRELWDLPFFRRLALGRARAGGAGPAAVPGDRVGGAGGGRA
jgi:branched-chain amino acid transport system permease protein